MIEHNRQTLSGIVKVLIQSELPPEFKSRKLYGVAEETEYEFHQDCKVFKLSNETGTGEITVYRVFTGIELYYNDMHMAYCNQNQDMIKNVIEINHCRTGRYECSFGENSCCYMAGGDLSIGSLKRKKTYSSFPLSHYHGITIMINLDELLPEVRQLMELLNIDLDYIQKYICEENRCCIMRANSSIEHIFSELYHVREQRKSGYMKIKMLELLLFLSDLKTDEEVVQVDYYSQSQVALIKSVAAYITNDITTHYTIEQLSQKFEISTTMLKKCFRGVYGTSVYQYLRTYRLQVAQRMLLETQQSVTEIANNIGYDNPNKFTSAFKEIYGVTPTKFRKIDHWDRKESKWSGEEV